MKYFVDITTGVYGDAEDIRIIDLDSDNQEAVGHSLDFYAEQSDDAAIKLIGSIYGLTLEEWAKRND
jgi:hypothetical protein